MCAWGRAVALRDELLFGRPDRLKVFVSSEMRSGLLDVERVSAADAVEQSGFHFAWYWERDASAGPYSSEGVCLGHARTSDCLILLLATDLTPITRMEYLEAKEAGAACFLFVHSGAKLSQEAAEFLKREMPHVVFKKFGSPTELQSAIVHSLLHHAVQATRRQQLERRAVMSSSRVQSELGVSREQ
jgi:hypothetical protein